MHNENNLNRNERREWLRLVAKVASPIALQSLLGSGLNLVDNLMVGHLGELALNAVGVSVQFYFIYWMFMFGFVSGTATFISQFHGVKDYASIKKTLGFTITVVMCIGIIFFCVGLLFPDKVLRLFTRFPEVIDVGADYIRIGAPTFIMVALIQTMTIGLRATQQTRYPLYASAIALCTNTLLNYLLIYGKLGLPAMGVRGAALATVCSRIVELSILTFIIFGRKNIIAGSFREYFSFNKMLASRVFRNSLPTTINETMWGIGTASYVAAFARISISAGAAVQACNTINNLFAMAAFSIGDAVLILVGQKLGEKEFDIAYRMARFMIRLGLMVGFIIGGLTLLMGKPILSLFDFSAQGSQDAWLILIVYAATLWLDVYNAVLVCGVLRCGGDTRFAAVTETSTVWLIGVPMAFITSLLLHWPVYLAVLCVKLEGVVKMIFLTRRYLSKKWLNNVVDDLES